MSGRFQPLNGADSPPCSICEGFGWVQGGDQPLTCPNCHGAYECGSCSRMVRAERTELLDAGTHRWRRCLDCRDRDRARYAEAMA